MKLSETIVNFMSINLIFTRLNMMFPWRKILLQKSKSIFSCISCYIKN